MEYESLNRMRRESRVQAVIIVLSLLGTALIILLTANAPAAKVQQKRVAQGAGKIESLSDIAARPAGHAEEAAPAIDVEPHSAVTEFVDRSDAALAAAESAPDGFVLEGRSVRSKLGSPLSFLPLRLTDPSGNEVAETRSSRDGKFIFTGIPNGKYYLDVNGELFAYRRKPVIIDGEDLRGLSLEAAPRDPAVRLPAYTEFAVGREVAAVHVAVFRLAGVRYSIYKLDLASTFVNVLSLDDYIGSEPGEAALLESFAREYRYNVPFSEVAEDIEFDLPGPGLYLLEARAGKFVARGLLSYSEFGLESTLDGTSLSVYLTPGSAAGPQPSAVVKAFQNGRLISEERTGADGYLRLFLPGPSETILMASDGSSFAYQVIDGEVRKVASK